MIATHGKLKNLGVDLDDTVLISAIIRAPPDSFSWFLDRWRMLDVEQQALYRLTQKAVEQANT